ncbi:MAG: transcription antitermination factor NusB [Kiritimatiellae bacterium]|nr:transcription antitermination factor NusB [Kiritimatiellia bacterium]MDW8458966.1 transcription antitermination factor NusB [Verrucomicrobiota bacterium]
MKSRHDARRLAVQFLFQRDFNAGNLDEDLELFWSDQPASAAVRRFADSLIRGVEANKPQIDQILGSCADHWDVRRMGAVDRNVMRVALYEMMHRPDIPHPVSIDEAVELAKELSSEESGRFVNGILDRARRDLQSGRIAVGAASENPAPMREG